MNYKQLLQSKEWIETRWLPLTRKSVRRRDRNAVCDCGETKEVVMMGGVATCKACLARDDVAAQVGFTSGVSDDRNWFLEQVEGIVAELQRGDFVHLNCEDWLREGAL